MKTLTVTVTRKDGKYIGTLDEYPDITCEAERIDDIVFNMKVSIMKHTEHMKREDYPEALKDTPLKFRICGSEEVFTDMALERDTKSRLALNERLDRMNENLERLSPFSVEEVALRILCAKKTFFGSFGKATQL